MDFGCNKKFKECLINLIENNTSICFNKINYFAFSDDIDYYYCVYQVDLFILLFNDLIEGCPTFFTSGPKSR